MGLETGRISPRRDGASPRVPPVRSRPGPSFLRAVLLTFLGAFIPGSGLLAAGRRRLGSGILAAAILLASLVGYVAVAERRTVLYWLVQEDTLRILAIVLPALGLAWTAVIVGTYRTLVPDAATTLQRVIGSVLVTALAFTVLTPLAVAGRYAQVQEKVIGTVFASSDSRSVTRPKNVTREDPWGGRDRVNVLLLGGDGGQGRQGIRPDSIQLASIDTRTGNTVLLGLPRNLEKVPFPEDSPLAEVYPDGIYDGPGDRLEWMLNAIYKDVPEQHPGLLDSDNPGADATKLAVSAVLDLEVDYYVLINLDGFKELINALGGITVNVNTRVAIGGSQDEGRPPHDWIEPGPNQHLDGYHALWFARGRYGASDYERMERQRCAIKAIIDQAQPTKVLTRYEAIARSSEDIVYTDIPSELLPAFVDLSMKVKNAKVTSIAFTNKVIKPWDPDYDKIRSMVRKALRESERDDTAGRTPPDRTAKPKPTKTAVSDPSDESGSPDEPGSSDGDSDGGSTSDTSEKAATSLEDACAYRPETG